MNQHAPDSRPRLTAKQGQYLAFIHAYRRLLGQSPAEADMQRFFQVASPSVPRLLLGFQGTKTARREGISSPFSDAGGCTSCRNSGNIDRMARSQCRHGLQRPAWDQERGSEDNPEGFRSCWHRFRQLTASACRRRAEETFDTKTL
jgi:hypothetical protein